MIDECNRTAEQYRKALERQVEARRRMEELERKMRALEGWKDYLFPKPKEKLTKVE